MEKIHMITYGNNIFSRAKERIKEEALHTTWYKSMWTGRSNARICK